MAMLVAAMLLNSSCIADTLHHEFKSIAGDGWSRQDTVCFDLPATDKEGLYAITTEVRCLPSFSYRHIFMVREMCFSAPMLQRTDTLCLLTDRANPAAVHQGTNIISYAMTDSVEMPQRSPVLIRFHHIMDRETLPYLLDIGVKVRY